MAGLLIYSENFYPIIGGAELQLWRLAEALHAKGVQTTVVTLQNKPSLPRYQRFGGVHVHRLPYPKRRFVDSIVVPWRLSSFLANRGSEYNFLHVQGISLAGGLALVLSHVLGKRSCFAIMGSEELYIRESTRVPPRLLFRLYGLSSSAVAINRAGRDYLIAKGIPPERIRIIPCGVDTSLFRPPERKENRDGATVIYVGRLVPVKGLSYLLHAWRRVASELRDTRLLIVGDGPLRSELEELARSLGIQHSVVFLGERRDVPALLHRADLAVLPSLSEGLPNSILESMACGLPVVASHLPGVAEVVHNGDNGILVEPRNVQQLADAIIGLLSAPDTRRAMGAKAAEMVRKQYSFARMVEAYLSLYEFE